MSQMGCFIFGFWSKGMQGDPEASVLRSERQSKVSDSAATKQRFQLKKVHQERKSDQKVDKDEEDKAWCQTTQVHDIIQVW